MPSMTNYHRKYGGKIELVEVFLAELIVTRPWAHKFKVEQYSGFTGKIKPLAVVETQDGLRYLVDGHHKGSANYLDGNDTGLAQLLTGSNTRLTLLLKKRNHGYLPEFSSNLR